MDTAKPEKGTVKQVAYCDRCGELIHRVTASDPWAHQETGEARCYDA